MTEGNMTGRPYGGADERPEGAPLPGEKPEDDEVTAAPQQSPRAAQGGMSEEVTEVPDRGEGAGRAPGMPDATGPQG